jgi:Icc-related predicted phosphoesterase
MKILHISDTHGSFPKLDTEGDIIVHSGDFFPNSQYYHMPLVEAEVQAQWTIQNQDALRNWIGSRPFFLCHGNHDFDLQAAEHLCDVGIDAHNISLQHKEIHGVKLYGIPYVPYFTGSWNFEKSDVFLEEHLRYDVYDRDIDVLVSHAPPYGCLDKVRKRENIGSKPLATYIKTAKKPARTVLCGHVHESGGLQRHLRGTWVSNAATKQNLLELDLD